MFGLHLKTIPSAFRLDCNNNVTPPSPFLLRTQVSAADYLATSLGVSPESLHRIGKHVDCTSTSNAESVIALFLQFGFTKTEIAQIFSNRPGLLKSDPHKILKPKLQFLVQSGFSGANLTHLITSDTHLITQSLSNQIAPCIRFLTAFFGTKHAVLSLFSKRRGSWISRYSMENVPPNLQTLRRHGVSDDNIVKLLLFGPSCVSHDPDVFEERVREVKKLGLDTSRKMFVRGIFVLVSMSEANRAAKLELFGRFGWSEELVWAMFVKSPMVLALSVERLEARLGFFKERLEWDSQEILQNPCVLMYGLEQRILPRFAVFDAFISRNYIAKGSHKWTYVLSLPEERFLERFVSAYQDEFPELLQLYHNNKKK